MQAITAIFIAVMLIISGFSLFSSHVVAEPPQYIVLENSNLYIELEKSSPTVNRYVLKSNGGVIYGDIARWGYAQVFYQEEFYYTYPIVDSITEESDRVCYHMRTEMDSKLVVTFDLCYVLSGFSVKVVFSNIHETPDYKLILVKPPDLLTVRATQRGAKLVFPYAEGRLIDITNTTPGYADVDYGRWDRPLLAGMLYHNNVVSICSYDHLDMVMYARVFDDSNEGRLGAIGMFFNYRYAPTNFDSATFIDVFDETTTSLSVNLIFVADYDSDLDVDWMDGAKFLRDQVQTTPEPRYLSSFITKIGRNGIDKITEHLETLRKLYHLTDHNKIYGYLLDCRQGTQILEFFGVEEDLDPDWASLAEVIDVFRIAEEDYNTFLSFHDNYTDYYPGTPGYDPALRVIQADGVPLPGWYYPHFPEGYHTDPYDYAVQEGIKRVKNTLARYPIKESYHIDVFNAAVDKDYSLASPSSRERNRRGLGLIIEAFNEFGVDVTSEILTGPFVESGIGWFLHIPRLFSNEFAFSDAEFIPLIEFIYHGKTLYGYGLYDLPPEQAEICTFLEPLLLGANSGAHITWSDSGDLELDKFYLIDLPWMALNQRFMKDYIADGSYRKITYDDDTFVEIDYDSNTYTVEVDGRVIGHSYATFFPKGENTFLIYSREAKTISESLPNEWGEDAALLKLTEDGINRSVPFSITNGRITFYAEANTPYKLIKLNHIAVTGVSPDSGKQGETLDVVIAGTNLAEVTEVSFGAGITVNSFTVASPVQITGDITITSDATPGSRDVSITTLSGTATTRDSFTVEENATGVSLSTWLWVGIGLGAILLGLVVYVVWRKMVHS